MSSSINSVGGGFNYIQMIQQMQDRFKAIDTDSNGAISKAEMQTAKDTQKSDTWSGASGMQVQSAMSSLMSSTGLSGAATTQDAMTTLQAVLENMASTEKSSGASLQQTLQDKFNKADTNGDGSLSQDEFQAELEAKKDKHLNGPGQYEKMSAQNSQQGFQDLLSMMTDTSTGNNDFANQFQGLIQQLGSGSTDKGDTLTKLATLISQNLPSVDVTV